MDVHPLKMVCIGIDPYPYLYRIPRQKIPRPRRTFRKKRRRPELSPASWQHRSNSYQILVPFIDIIVIIEYPCDIIIIRLSLYIIITIIVSVLIIQILLFL